MKQANLQQIKEIKDAIKELNKQMVGINTKIISDHQEVMNKIEVVDKKTKEALHIATKNQTKIIKIKENNTKMKEEITKDQKEIHSQTADQIKKVEAQLKAVMVELEDLRNRSMRSTLVFKNIREEGNEKWERNGKIPVTYYQLLLPQSYNKSQNI